MGIIQALQNIVGAKHVSTAEPIRECCQYNAFMAKEFDLKPDIVVLAETTEQVSAIIKAANEYKVPLTPKGAQGSGGLGGTFKGGIHLDLSLMDKIISIDTNTLKVIAEAGCSFYKLAQELFKKGIMLPTPPYDSGPNVAASAIDPANGFGKTQYGPNIDLVEGFEVVLPSGEITGVGSLAYADYDFGPYYRYITGPDLIGLFTKSNGAFGIVTKVAYQGLPFPKHWAFHSYYWPYEQLPYVTKTLMEAIKNETFDIHFNDKYRWIWEGPVHIPEGSYFDVTMMVNANSEKELRAKEEIVQEICINNRGTYLPGLAQYLYSTWPTVFLAGHPRVGPPMPNICTETLGERGSFYIMDDLMFPTEQLTDVYSKMLECCQKNKLHQLPMHPVFDGYPMKRQVISAQYWSYIDDGNPEMVERYFQARNDFRDWYGKRGGMFQAHFPPIVPDYAWKNQMGALNLLQSIKKTLDPNNILSPYTFEMGSAK